MDTNAKVMRGLMAVNNYSRLAAESFINNLTPPEIEGLAAAVKQPGENDNNVAPIDVLQWRSAFNAASQRILNEQKSNVSEDDGD